MAGTPAKLALILCSQGFAVRRPRASGYRPRDPFASCLWSIKQRANPAVHGPFPEEHDGEPLLRPLAIESDSKRKSVRRPFFGERPMDRSGRC